MGPARKFTSASTIEHLICLRLSAAKSVVHQLAFATFSLLFICEMISSTAEASSFNWNWCARARLLKTKIHCTFECSRVAFMSDCCVLHLNICPSFSIWFITSMILMKRLELIETEENTIRSSKSGVVRSFEFLATACVECYVPGRWLSDCQFTSFYRSIQRSLAIQITWCALQKCTPSPLPSINWIRHRNPNSKRIRCTQKHRPWDARGSSSTADHKQQYSWRIVRKWWQRATEVCGGVDVVDYSRKPRVHVNKSIVQLRKQWHERKQRNNFRFFFVSPLVVGVFD